ncbi:MerR family transcriptional regulator [Propionispora hippei]|uniref:MerR HTH family regulatory protein n=1 Tax=Propionispora hippei DSM 15287 TaxID=1123003 RepID=A0A1M6PBF5_9FIRM|nr:MerR HTH family regulatory protein [Propionispora hippei DSM 15287]
MYTVKEVAEKLCLTEHTVRFYTDKGLVPSLQRDKNNNRFFDEDSIDWLICVKCLKECGMSIDSIKIILSFAKREIQRFLPTMKSCWSRVKMLTHNWKRQNSEPSILIER